jgi:hypothetical protein
VVTPPPTLQALRVQCGKMWPLWAFRPETAQVAHSLARKRLMLLRAAWLAIDECDQALSSANHARRRPLIVTETAMNIDICPCFSYVLWRISLISRDAFREGTSEDGASAVLPCGFALRAGAASGIIPFGITTEA